MDYDYTIFVGYHEEDNISEEPATAYITVNNREGQLDWRCLTGDEAKAIFNLLKGDE